MLLHFAKIHFISAENVSIQHLKLRQAAGSKGRVNGEAEETQLTNV